VSSRSFVRWGILAHGLAVAACADMAPPGVAARALPAYQGRAAELFDDAIEASAVGYDLGGMGPKKVARDLAELAQSADSIVRARVVTVTVDPGPSGASWQVGLHPVATVGGTSPSDEDFTLVIRSSDPSSGLLRAVEQHLVGTTFVAFTREFVAISGEQGPPVPALHFHIVRDSREELDAIRAALVLGEVR
jgi:hypothetical protein